ncbi:MAG: hypothetical protein JOY71_10570 [Acetobacteraceae bacterium]|nr:hypothetical protein [Acetobacteraceae bacterium]MBV8522546.1 hypothetical protein [Acetobacteraceae bacterium]
MQASFDPRGTFSHLREQLASATSLCDAALKALDAQGDVPFFAPGETDDHLAYRHNRRPAGPLSELGRRVGEAFLRAGFSDAATGIFMSVSDQGIAGFRRRLGLPPGTRTKR